MNWRRPIFLFFCAAAIALTVTSLSTTHWVKTLDLSIIPNQKLTVRFGIFEGCIDTVNPNGKTSVKCTTLSLKIEMRHGTYDWPIRVKSLDIVSVICSFVALVVAYLKAMLGPKIKGFVGPAIMLIATIIMFSAVAIYTKYHKYLFNGNEITNLSYDWSFIMAWLGCVTSVIAVIFGFWADFVDVFGSSEEEFRSKRLQEIA